jgi:hypothetical protein
MKMKSSIISGLSILLVIGLTHCESAAKKAEPERVRALKEDSLEKAIEEAKDEAPAAGNASIAKDINLNTSAPKDKKLIKTAEVKFKVNNVQKVTESIEDIAAHYNGYVTYSHLSNSCENYGRSRISRDSIVNSRQIVVESEIILRIPNEQLDSLVRELNKYVVFLDYRTIQLNDVTFKYAANEKRNQTLKQYQKRQNIHIDTKGNKLKETTTAEETVLDSRLQSDDLDIQKQELEDQLKYCTLTIYIYQKSVIVKETIANFEYISNEKPNIFKRILNAIVLGWRILEEIIVFLVQIWGIILLIVCGLIGVRFLIKKKDKH